MPCYHPLGAFQTSVGKPLFFGKSSVPRGARYIEVPCGQCIGCRLEYSREWAVRCVCEAKMHKENSFLTLTYDDDHVPGDGSLHHEHFVDFMKRFRYYLAERGFPRISYYMGGEYGELYSRPHYHSIVFGFCPVDLKYWMTSKAGYKIYTSEIMDKLWTYGRVFVGDVTFESAAYVARYCLKKVKDGSDRREILDVVTGELIYREHEYGCMSLRPAIGKRFLEKYASDIYFNDRIVVRGVSHPLPRYFDVELEKISPLFSQELKAKRRAAAAATKERVAVLHPDLHPVDAQFERLKVEEMVKLASINFLKRGD